MRARLAGARLSPFTSREHDSTVDFSNSYPTDARIRIGIGIGSVSDASAADRVRVQRQRSTRRPEARHDPVSLADSWHKTEAMESIAV